MEQDESRAFRDGACKEQRKPKEMKLGHAERRDNAAEFRFAAVCVHRQPRLEVYRSPRARTGDDAREETKLLRAQQVPPFLHAIGKLLEFLVQNLLVARIDLPSSLLDFYRKLFSRALVDERRAALRLISRKVDQ